MNDRTIVEVGVDLFQFRLSKFRVCLVRDHWIPSNPRPDFRITKHFWRISRNNIGLSGFRSDLTTELSFRFKHYFLTITTFPPYI